MQCQAKFLSTLSLRRATHFDTLSALAPEISIHALLAESDNSETQADPAKSISIHALLAESDSKPRDLKSRRMAFLSTLSLRRATPRRPHGPPRGGISIHALLAESDVILSLWACSAGLISIHALLAESDSSCCGWQQIFDYFYPRSPCGERQGGTQQNDQ